MAKTCNDCKAENTNVTVPYVVHEATVARQERQIKRMWIALIVSIALMFFTNMIWVGVFGSYDYLSEEIVVEQDAQDGGNNNYIGNDGDINNGVSENNNSQEETDQKER